MYMAVIFYLSSLSHPPMTLQEIPDYVLHSVEYFFLGMLLLRGFSLQAIPIGRGAQYLLTLWITTLYGISDEIHQLFVPHREFSIHDIVADSVGAVLAITVFCLMRFLKTRFLKTKDSCL
jgi:VanZ family protein